MKRYSLVVICLLAFITGFSQKSEDLQKGKDSLTLPKTQLIAGISYNSALNYYGRVDSLRSSGIYPFAGILFKNGLYVASSFIFINNATGTAYAATILEGGYRFDHGHWSGILSGSQFFYSNDVLLQSAVHQQLAFNLKHTGKVVSLNMGADAKFSEQADLGVQAGIDHRMQFGSKIIVVIDPSLYGYAGTQNFTRSYLQQAKFLLFPGPEQLVTERSRRFSILSYELSCPLTLAIGKMSLVFTPAYVMPQNLVAGESAEKAVGLFYATTTLRFTF